MLSGNWSRSIPCQCRSPVGRTPAFMLCPTRPTLTCSAGTISRRLLLTFWLMLLTIIWGQNRLGESELFRQVKYNKAVTLMFLCPFGQFHLRWTGCFHAWTCFDIFVCRFNWWSQGSYQWCFPCLYHWSTDHFNANMTFFLVPLVVFLQQRTKLRREGFRYSGLQWLS